MLMVSAAQDLAKWKRCEGMGLPWQGLVAKKYSTARFDSRRVSLSNLDPRLPQPLKALGCLGLGYRGSTLTNSKVKIVFCVEGGRVPS